MAQDTGGQPFSFAIADSALAQAGGVTLDALHTDVEAICRACEGIEPVARRLGVEPPSPRIAGFCYAPLAGLGARVVFPEDTEPFLMPLIDSPEQIDDLTEPEDYLAADLTRKRLALLHDLKRRRPDAVNSIGHLVEGPVTAAALIFGRQQFFTLPYEDPERAHRLMAFSARSMIGYARAISEHSGEPLAPGPRGIPDDFAGIFPPPVFEEFVAPYWDEMYEGLRATERTMHSELLRVDHMPFLKQLRIGLFDPSGDQYLTPELLRDHCPARFILRIQSWHVRDMSSRALQDMYRYLAGFRPASIAFSMTFLEEELKLEGLLQLARELRSG